MKIVWNPSRSHLSHWWIPNPETVSPASEPKWQCKCRSRLGLIKEMSVLFQNLRGIISYC
jgi:hypothetical protein